MATTSNAPLWKKTPFHVSIFAKQTPRKATQGRDPIHTSNGGGSVVKKLKLNVGARGNIATDMVAETVAKTLQRTIGRGPKR